MARARTLRARTVGARTLGTRTLGTRTLGGGVGDERGVTTAEYAVATAAGAGFAGLLYKLLSGGFGDQLIKTLFDHVLNLLGLR